MPTSSEPFEVLLAATFQRALRRFLRQHRELEPAYRRLVSDLEVDLFQAKLRLHALRGALDGFHAVSLAYSERVNLILRFDERSITLVDIGDHDDVYR